AVARTSDRPRLELVHVLTMNPPGRRCRRRGLHIHDPRSARTPRTKPSAISARALVAEIGAESVSERVTERKSAKRTRTGIVRPVSDLAPSRAADAVGEMMEGTFEDALDRGLSSERRLCASRVRRRRVWIWRRSRFHASAVNFLPAACPSNRS